MKGSHYNRAWLVHNTVTEAMERLLMLRFFGELKIHLNNQTSIQLNLLLNLVRLMKE